MAGSWECVRSSLSRVRVREALGDTSERPGATRFPRSLGSTYPITPIHLGTCLIRFIPDPSHLNTCGTFACSLDLTRALLTHSRPALSSKAPVTKCQLTTK